MEESIDLVVSERLTIVIGQRGGGGFVIESLIQPRLQGEKIKELPSIHQTMRYAAFEVYRRAAREAGEEKALELSAEATAWLKSRGRMNDKVYLDQTGSRGKR